MMQIIPVIDLLNGQVVHAKKGERQHYQPIQSDLTPSSKPLDIVAALLAVYPFEQLYIADLNAIQKLHSHSGKNCDENNYNVITTIKQCYPNLELWIDSGISNNTELSFWQKLNARLIIGSENFAKIDNFTSLKFQDKNFILSLDFMPDGYQGPAELLTDPKYWPQDVIIMSLLNVGSNDGANAKLIHAFITCRKEFNLIAAGGIRDIDDLLMLKNMGVKAALIATALHKKQISMEQLTSLRRH